MLRKILAGAAGLLLAGSMALAGEGPAITVEARLDIGVVEEIVSSIEGNDVIEYDGLSIQPSVAVNAQFSEQWSASLQFRGLFGFEDDDAEVVGTDGESTFDMFEIGGLAGYTFKVNDQFSVTPVLGLSWQSWDLEGDDSSGDTGTFETSLLFLDFGAKMAFTVNDKVSIRGALMLAIPVAGSTELDAPGIDEDADVDGGFRFGISGGVEYKLNDKVTLVGGLAYTMADVDWDWGSSVDGEDELDSFALRLGVVFSF